MIHYMPRVYTPVPRPGRFLRDPIPRKINARRFLTAEDIRSIRNIFPSSIGVRLLISGWVVIHFEDVKTMKSAWESGFPDTVGALRVGCMVTRFVPSFPVGYGHAINSDGRGNEECCLGLRLTLPTGQEVITTTTHGFVKLLDSNNSFRLRISDWYLKLRNALRTSKSINPSYTSIGSSTSSEQTNSPLGKRIWLAGGNTLVSRHSFQRYVDFAESDSDAYLGRQHNGNVRPVSFRPSTVSIRICP
jgi:hypothetical protein